MMRAAMLKAKSLGKLIVAHCEDNSLLRGGYIHDGEYAAAHGHKGICAESEWGPIARDARLAKETGCAYHVCHISCAESVALIRDAKRNGDDISCETAPHYFWYTDETVRKLEGIQEYWRGKSVSDVALSLLGDEELKGSHVGKQVFSNVNYFTIAFCT